MIARNRPARVAAAAAITAVAGAAAMLAVSTTASADEPGRCLQNVNVREDPDAESRIVALCEAGTRVKLGEERDGFVRIDEMGGWAAGDYVKADESSGTDRGNGAGSSDERSGDDGANDDGSNDDGSDHDSNDSSSDDRPDDRERPSTDEITSGHDADLDGLLS